MSVITRRFSVRSAPDTEPVDPFHHPGTRVVAVFSGQLSLLDRTELVEVSRLVDSRPSSWQELLARSWSAAARALGP